MNTAFRERSQLSTPDCRPIDFMNDAGNEEKSGDRKRRKKDKKI
jgi:hypothetical protein